MSQSRKTARINFAHEIPLMPNWPEAVLEQIPRGGWVVVPAAAIEIEPDDEEPPTC